MNEYTDNDDLGLYLTFIKTINIDYSKNEVIFQIAKPYDSFKYIEGQLVLRKVNNMDFEQNFKAKETPEFYRSAILESSVGYDLSENEKVYFFGVEWASEYFLWHIVAQGYDFKFSGNPVLLKNIEWVK